MNILDIVSKYTTQQNTHNTHLSEHFVIIYTSMYNTLYNVFVFDHNLTSFKIMLQQKLSNKKRCNNKQAKKKKNTHINSIKIEQQDSITNYTVAASSLMTESINWSMWQSSIGQTVAESTQGMLSTNIRQTKFGSYTFLFIITELCFKICPLVNSTIMTWTLDNM